MMTSGITARSKSQTLQGAGAFTGIVNAELTGTDEFGDVGKVLEFTVLIEESAALPQSVVLIKSTAGARTVIWINLKSDLK